MIAREQSVLLVRHGPGRGRLPGYLEQVLDALRAADPELHRRIRRHHTGEPPPDLDGCSAVVFWLGDPLREHFPECYADAVLIADAARTRGIRLVNAPEALSNTVKSTQARLWREARIPTPSQYRFESRRELDALLPQVSFPAVVRADDEHAQRGMRLMTDAASVRDLPDAALCLPGAIAPFVDTRTGWPAGSPYARYRHKKRLMVLGDVVRNIHVFFSDAPFVSMGNSTFQPRLRPRGVRSWTAELRHRRYDAACLRVDLEFWMQETDRPELMQRAVRALGLGFAAIDYSELADGSVMLWEANPYFHLPPWNQNIQPLERRLEERHPPLHAAFVEFFRTLLA